MMLESNPINPIISSHYPNLIMYDNNLIYKFHSKDIIIYIYYYITIPFCDMIIGQWEFSELIKVG